MDANNTTSTTAARGGNNLIPSQSIRSGNNSNNGSAMDNQAPSRRQRRRKPQRVAAAESTTPDNVGAAPSANAETNVADQKPPARNLRKNKKTVKKANVVLETEDKKAPAATTNNPRKRRARKKAPAWKAQVANDAVDPITLEPLVSLNYPPFALAASPPYDSVPEWPIANTDVQQEKVAENVMPTLEERQQLVMQEQWGDRLKAMNATSSTNDKEIQKPSSNDVDDKKQETINNTETLTSYTAKRHLHLYDGQALAYWMVGSNQYMDPLNRRDVTRDELRNLDAYLQRHGFDSINVTDAYDTKGVTISTAGAVGSTPEGRAAIRRQEANNLLNALFGGNRRPTTSISQRPQSQSNNNSNNNNHNYGRSRQDELLAQYQAFEQSQAPQQFRAPSRTNGGVDNLGVYGDAGGIMVIDDDLQPGLRGTAPEFVPGSINDHTSYAANGNMFWSASHIASRCGQARLDSERDFPTLGQIKPVTDSNASNDAATNTATRSLPKVKTLSRISKVIKKTDPEEQQRQLRAREAARRKAQMANMTFGSNPAPWDNMGGLPTLVPNTISTTLANESGSATNIGQLQRNKALADALGVAPSTVRHNTGWERPSNSERQLDEYGRELDYAVYPESLVKEVREMVPLLNKIERRWRVFLADDKAASLPLGCMDKKSRKFVHEYGAYWKLHTESFDPEPKRYVYCVKLLDTAAPYPLLSQVAASWRPNTSNKYVGAPPTIMGPIRVNSALGISGSDHPSQQTAGQSTRSTKEVLRTEVREALPLIPRSTVGGGVGLNNSNASATRIGGSPLLSTTAINNNTADGTAVLHNRFSNLAPTTSQRPKLQLLERTLPVEYDSQQHDAAALFDASASLEIQRQRQVEDRARKAAMTKKKEQMLAKAFASDDEDDSERGDSYDDSDSEWEEQEAVYVSDNDDEDKV